LASALKSGTVGVMRRFFRTGRAFARLFFGLFLAGTGGVGATEFLLAPGQPTLDRMMYPFTFDGGTRPVGFTFGSFDPRFDTRDGQLLLGWDTAGQVPIQKAPSRYLLKRLRVTLSIYVPPGLEGTFEYDPTHDAMETYATNQPVYVPDADLGRPVELTGAAFRGGFLMNEVFVPYDAGTFRENSPYGPLGPTSGSNISIGTRNAFAAVHDRTGELVDISNNVGQSNPTFTGGNFEIRPWAVGMIDGMQPGELVPEGALMHFDVDLEDPLVAGYVQAGLAEGRLRFFVTSLHPAAQSGFGGVGAYPLFHLKETLLGTAPKLELEGTVVGVEDTDQDGMPDDWERFYFGNLDAEPDDDADGDGESNRREWGAGTNPRRATSVLSIREYRMTAGGAVLRFGMAAGRRYEVESSVDLKTWGPALGRLVYPEVGVAEWVEEDPRVPPVEPVQRFFRVLSRE